MICSSGKPPLSIRMSVTDKCQLRCSYCMPAEGIVSCSHHDILRFEELADVVKCLQKSFDVSKVRLTGGEPLARKNIVSLVAAISDLGIPDLAMTTNAQKLAQLAPELRDAGLQRVNISLDSLSHRTFGDITRGGSLDRTLEGITAAIQSDFQSVKLNMVVMQGINDHEVYNLLSFALDRGCEMRFLELMPIGYGSELFDKAFVSTASVLQMLSDKLEIEPLEREKGSSSRRYGVRQKNGLGGVMGFISPCTDSFCSDCSRLRITAKGRMIGCLAREDGVDIRPLLRTGSDGALAEAAREVMQHKRLDQKFEQSALMAGIGG